MNEDLKQVLVIVVGVFSIVFVILSLVFGSYVLIDKYNYNKCLKRNSGMSPNFMVMHCNNN